MPKLPGINHRRAVKAFEKGDIMDKWDVVKDATIDAAINAFWKLHMSPDEKGAPRAKELIKWYITGKGKKFYRDDAVWGSYMKSMPEIQSESDRFYNTLAEELCEDGEEKAGTFDRDARQIKLKTEAMRFTLHGCHRLNVAGSYKVERTGGIFTVQFKDNTWRWIDQGYLHKDATRTIFNSGKHMEDKKLGEIGTLVGGQTYDIEIVWKKSETKTVPRQKTKCNAECKDYKRYGDCDNPTYDGERCWRH